MYMHSWRLYLAFVLLAAIIFFATNLFIPDSKSGHMIENSQPAKISIAPLDMPKPVPAIHLPMAVDAGISNLVDRSLPMSVRVPDDISTRIPNVANAEDIAPLVKCLMDVEDDDTARNEAANLLARSHYSGLFMTLSDILENPAESARFRSFAAQHLGEQVIRNDAGARQNVIAKLRELLADKDSVVRREALLALVRQKDGFAVQTSIQWLNDPHKDSDVMRDLTIRCVRELDLRDQIPTVRKFARDLNEVTRIAALTALSQWYDDDSRPAFLDAEKSKNPRIRNAGRAALERLSSLDRVVPVGQQTLENLTVALRNGQPFVRHAAARAIRKYSSDIDVYLPTLVIALRQLDGSVRTDDIGAYFETIRAGGERAHGATTELVSMLGERCPIYQGRPMDDVHHLRGFLLLTLADIGSGQDSMQYITEYLANSDRQLTYAFTCAAYAAQHIQGTTNMAKLLQRGLTKDIEDRPIWLASFDRSIKTTEAATSPRLEAIRALAQFGPTAISTLPSLIAIKEEKRVGFGSMQYVSEAEKAIQRIRPNSLKERLP